ncbi:MAG: energy-coupled thiamine transporter ThiT, partial [Clostridia bacterium]|nr:energy-coupled thiamine transporter ThiT [Clostridia bacterium]
MNKQKLRMMTEGGIMVALAFILSFIKVVDMPFGGSITACSMVPIILIAYRYAKKISWGILIAFLYSMLQLLMDFGAMRKSVDWKSLIAILILDYVIAFTVLGLGGIFKKFFKNQWNGLMAGAALACTLRFVCHTISGCTVWAGVSVPTADGLWYSILYNAAYMVPETLLTIGVCFYIGRMLDLETLKGVKRETKGAVLVNASWLIAAAAVVFDAIYLFMQMQNENGFDISLVSQNDLLLTGGILAATAVVV